LPLLARLVSAREETARLQKLWNRRVGRANGAKFRRVWDYVATPQSTHPPAHAHGLEEIVLQDDDGHDVRLGDLWANGPAALAFLRHWGCVFCRQHAVELHRARKDFEAAGVTLAAIGHGTVEQAAAFRRAQGVEIRLLVDHDRSTYEAAGAKVATFGELFAPSVIAAGAKHTIMSRVKQGSIVVHQGRIIGSAAQLGGVLVIAPDGSVRYAHLAKNAADSAPAREVLAAAKAIRPHAHAL
jgi:peroxiredoxin